MAKRFTDTDKFSDPWYRRLSTKNKLLWDWMLCSCDHAGLISIDLEFVEMVIGEKFEDDVIEAHFSDRIYKLSPFKYFIPKFIKFQYGELNAASRIHASVIKKLLEHGIDYMRFDTLSVKSHTLKDKDKAKDKEQDKDQDKEQDKDQGLLTVSNVLKILNSVCLTDFRYGAAHARHINARIQEGFTLEDFAAVVKFRQTTWGNDPKMHIYIRPETLFGTKMDSYLQESKKPFKGKFTTPENPTGNPYTAQRLAAENGEIA